MGSDMVHPGVLDADLFSKEFAFLPQTLILRRQSHAAADVAGSHPTGMDNGEMSEGDRMQNC